MLQAGCTHISHTVHALSVSSDYLSHMFKVNIILHPTTWVCLSSYEACLFLVIILEKKHMSHKLLLKTTFVTDICWFCWMTQLGVLVTVPSFLSVKTNILKITRMNFQWIIFMTNNEHRTGPAKTSLLLSSIIVTNILLKVNDDWIILGVTIL